MPTPTTLATIGVGMLLAGRWLSVLLLIPVLWALVSAAFTLKLDLFEPYVIAVALIALVVGIFTLKAD